MDTVEPCGRREDGGRPYKLAECNSTAASEWWNDQQGNHLKLRM